MGRHLAVAAEPHEVAGAEVVSPIADREVNSPRNQVQDDVSARMGVGRDALIGRELETNGPGTGLVEYLSVWSLFEIVE